MGRLRSFGRMDTAWRLHNIGGPDLALRYLRLSERSHRPSERAATGRAYRDPATTRVDPPKRSVIINEVWIGDEDVENLERAVGMKVKDGSYWYDKASGAWGVKGGPCAGFILAGLSLGGPLRRDASYGDTGVFVNGRELHALDVIALRRLGPLFPGRYWSDAVGNFGLEGGPQMGNLAPGGRFAGGSAWTTESGFGSFADGAGFQVLAVGRMSRSN